MSTNMRTKNKARLAIAAMCFWLLAFPLAAQQNYIRTFTPKQALSTSANLTMANSFRETSYFDTAGRRIQTVNYRLNPSAKDMADYVVYDSLGRKVREWETIPFSSNNGNFKPLSEFENSDYSAYHHVDFGYEASTLNRLVSETGRNTAGHAITTEYLFSDDGTPVYKYSANGTTITNDGAFPSGSLQCTKVTDEDGGVLYTFRDPQGKVVLERRTAADADHLDTYYIYNVCDLLVCVLPPAASEAMEDTGAYTLSGCDELDQYAYFFDYDERMNCISKKLPGAGWWYYVYDGDDRLALSQSPNQREDDLWSFIKYDNLGRTVVEGTMTTDTSADLLRYAYSTQLAKETYTGVSTPLLGYSNEVSLGQVETILKVNYYDDYRFRWLDAFSMYAPQSNMELLTSVYDKGYLTGTYTALTSGYEGEVAMNTYDRRGRLTVEDAYSYITECRRTRVNQYNFSNLVTGYRTLWTFFDGTTLQDSVKYTYDVSLRERSANLRMTYEAEDTTLNRNGTLSSLYYDDFCRPRTHYLYNLRGTTTLAYRLDGKLQSRTNKYFTETFNYEEINQFGMQYFNGRISSIGINQMGQEYSMHMQYDSFGRLVDVITPDLGYRESFGYDAMGNITSLMRRAPNQEYCLTEFAYDGNHLTSSENYSSSSVGIGNGLDYLACSGNNPYLYDANGNETRNLSQNMASATYNLLNLPEDITMADGNGLSFGYLADGRRVETVSTTWYTPLILPLPGQPPVISVRYDTEQRFGELTFRDNIPVRYDFRDGYFSLYNDSLAVPILHPYVYIKDYLGSVRLTVDAIANNNGTGNARQGMEYLPSGAVFRSTNYAFQPRRFCEKELVTMHGWNMYDSNARFQYSLLPRFSTMDPLAEKYYSFSPYNYAGNDFVNFADNNGDSIHIGTAENQLFFTNALSQVFGENSKNFSFTNTGMLVYNDNERSSGFTKDQKAVFTGLNRLMQSKVTTEIIYGDSPSYVDTQGCLNNIDLKLHGGAASINVNDNRNSSVNYIFVNPGATHEIEVYATTPAYYMQPIRSQNGARFVKMSIATNMADRTFHEIGHIIYAGKSQDKVINYNNIVRKILGLDSRPYDENHNRTIR